MKVACPRCQQTLEVDDRRVRRPVKCPVCRHVFNIPTTPSAPRKSGGPGCGSVLLLLALLAAGGFGYAMFRFHETPAQVWARVTAFIGTFRQPDIERPPVTPAPSATPAPAVPASLTPVPGPSALASPSPTVTDPTRTERPTPRPAPARIASGEEVEATLRTVYTPQATTFRLFAPGARSVNVVLYNEAQGSEGRIEHPLRRATTTPGKPASTAICAADSTVSASKDRGSIRSARCSTRLRSTPSPAARAPASPNRPPLVDNPPATDNVWDVDCSSFFPNTGFSLPVVGSVDIHGAYFVTDGTLELMRQILKGIDRGVLDQLGYTKGNAWPP